MGYKDRFYVALFSGFAFFVKKAPKSFKKKFIKTLAKVIYLIDKKHRKYASINIQAALNSSEKEKKEIMIKTYENLLFLLKDFIENQNTTKENILKKVQFKNEEYLLKLLKDNKPLLLMTAHYGNWELIPLALSAKYNLALSIVGRPLESISINEIVKKNREQFNIEVIPKRRAMKKLIKAIQDRRAVGILVDQHTTDREGIEIDFFGMKAMHTPALSLLSRKFEAPILPLFISTQNHEDYTITFYPPIDPIKSENEEEDILKLTQAQANITQNVIEKNPKEWFWLHRRWKKVLNYDS